MYDEPKTIDDVLQALDAIIDRSIKENNVLGIFAYLYRRTTFEVKSEIEKGAFEDNERMAAFDVAFANLYLQAFKNYLQQTPVCNSWKISFEARKSNLTIMQHLLMGMNAHINYDLGIAASEIMKGKPIHELENDFRKVNAILAQLIDEMQKRIGRVSYLMFVLDFIGGRQDERLINYNMIKARHESWNIATELWNMKDEHRPARIKLLDEEVKLTSEMIKRPPSIALRLSLKMVKTFEVRNVGKVISRLKS